MDFSNKTLEELEFNRVLDQISYYSLTKIGKENCRLIRPSNEKKKILNQLNLALSSLHHLKIKIKYQTIILTILIQ